MALQANNNSEELIKFGVHLLLTFIKGLTHTNVMKAELFVELQKNDNYCMVMEGSILSESVVEWVKIIANKSKDLDTMARYSRLLKQIKVAMTICSRSGNIFSGFDDDVDMLKTNIPFVIERLTAKLSGDPNNRELQKEFNAWKDYQYFILKDMNEIDDDADHDGDDDGDDENKSQQVNENQDANEQDTEYEFVSDDEDAVLNNQCDKPYRGDVYGK